MLQDTDTIRYYQRLTDAMVEMWQRGSHYEDIRNYMDGYIACLRHSNAIEAYLINRLEEDSFKFLRDPSNFELSMPRTQTELDYDYR
ncbi:MAG: hypothetical protein HC796_12295 [Synechococcaceae cyanobacterium RL_1_2]|nr:hypothetical protein [Synechococcaceae cyanobacterium RL_1_2]